MPGIADLLYLGQPDPMRQLQMQLAGQAPPGQQGPQGPGPQGGAPPQAQDPNQPITPGANVPNAPPQPQALQSSPDMQASYAQLASPQGNNIMSLYLQAQQRAAASDQINRGLALIAANHAGNPGMARAIMESASGGGINAGGMMGDLMQIYNFQYAQQQRQAFEHALPDLAAKSGLSVDALRVLGPQGVATMLERQEQANLPTDQIRTWQQARKIYADAHPGASQDEIDAAVPMAGFLGPQGGDAMQTAWLHARSQIPPSEWGDHPELKDALTYGLYMQDQKKRQDNQDAAGASFQGYDTALGDLRNKLTTIQNNPDLQNVLQTPALIAAVKSQRAGTFTGDWAGWLAQNHYGADQVQLVNDILDVSDPDTLKTLQAKSSPITAGDTMPIVSAVSSLGRLGSAPKQYGTMLSNAIDAVNNASANNKGASGQLDTLTDDERNRVSGAYLPGGAAFVGRGKTMPPDEITAAKELMKTTPKATVIHQYRSYGFNTKPIE